MLAATGVVGHSSSRVFFITDKSSGTRFLIDTGADVSVIPPSHTDRSHRQDFCLQAVNNTPIPTYGTRSLTLTSASDASFTGVSSLLMSNVLSSVQTSSTTSVCW